MTLYEVGYENSWVTLAVQETFTAKAENRLRSWLNR